MSTFTIPEGHQFSCISLCNANCGFRPQNATFSIENSVHILSSNNLEMDEVWKDWLGELLYEDFKNSNVVLISHLPSENSQDIKKITDKIVGVLFATILLMGVKHYETGIKFHGRREDKISITSVGEIKERIYISFDKESLRISEENLNLIKTIFSSLKKVHKQYDPYRRLGNGFEAYCDASTHRFLDDHLHQYVRSIEALLNANKAKLFAERCMSFFNLDNSDDAEIYKKLKLLYTIRGKVEHFNLLDPSKEVDEMAYLVKLISTQLYIKVLSNEELLCYFESDKKLKKFWKKPEDERADIIGELIDWNELNKSYMKFKERINRGQNK